MELLDFTVVTDAWQIFTDGILLTVFLTIITCVGGVFFGIICAWCRVFGAHWIRWLVSSYVEFFRNTPFLVQLFFIYFGLPAVGFKLTSVTASVLALILNLTAYACEIIRAGIDATPKGQFDAAQSLALNQWQVFTRIVIPPALGRVWTGLTSQLIIIMLATSLCSQISAPELSYVANFIAGRTFRTFEPYVVATIAYLILAILLREFLYWLGPKVIFKNLERGVAS